MSNSTKKLDHRKYNEAWEAQFTWLTLKDGQCFCKFCNRSLSQFKKHNLVSHENTARHKKNKEGKMDTKLKSIKFLGDEKFKFVEISPVEQSIDLPSDVNIGKDFFTNSIENEDDANIGTSEGDKVEWETDPKLKDCMLPHPEDTGKVICKYCNSSLQANKTELYKHWCARKRSGNVHNSLDELNLKPQLITKKLKGPGGSIVIVRSEKPLFSQGEGGNSHFDYGDNDHVETTIQSESPRKEPDQEIREMATRVGKYLMDDLEALLKSQGSVFKTCRSAGGNAYSDGNLRRMAKICVAHLSQKYLVESVVESKSTDLCVMKQLKELSTKFQDIEEKMERTVEEMRNLKQS